MLTNECKEGISTPTPTPTSPPNFVGLSPCPTNLMSYLYIILYSSKYL